MAVTSVDTGSQNRKLLITIHKLYMRDWCMNVNSVIKNVNMKE